MLACTVGSILESYKCHQYKIQPADELNKGDPDRRLAYSNIITERLNNDTHLLLNIYSSFFYCTYNRHNCYYASNSSQKTTKTKCVGGHLSWPYHQAFLFVWNSKRGGVLKLNIKYRCSNSDENKRERTIDFKKSHWYSSKDPFTLQWKWGSFR